MIALVLLLVMFADASFDESNCPVIVSYQNGSRSGCYDDRCNDHLDISSLDLGRCRTNYLSLRFSSYSIYANFLRLASQQTPLSALFSSARPNLERLLQIEFRTSLVNDQAFQLRQWRLLSNAASNIDTYELIFADKLIEGNATILLDRDMFLADEQDVIDTLRISFHCNDHERVEWELVKSISSLPESPCPQQIRFHEKPSFSPRLCFSINTFMVLSLILIGLKRENIDVVVSFR